MVQAKPTYWETTGRFFLYWQTTMCRWAIYNSTKMINNNSTKSTEYVVSHEAFKQETHTSKKERRSCDGISAHRGRISRTEQRQNRGRTERITLSERSICSALNVAHNCISAYVLPLIINVTTKAICTKAELELCKKLQCPGVACQLDPDYGCYYYY